MRPPLTKKALDAISTYATIKGGEHPIHWLMVRHVLDADRMPREQLYAWLEQRGYRWRPRQGLWLRPPHGRKAG